MFNLFKPQFSDMLNRNVCSDIICVPLHLFCSI